MRLAYRPMEPLTLAKVGVERLVALLTVIVKIHCKFGMLKSISNPFACTIKEVVMLLICRLMLSKYGLFAISTVEIVCRLKPCNPVI